MGVGIGDVNLDGNLDIFKTHFMDDTNVLYVNDGKGYFDNQTIAAGLGVETRFVNWGAGIVDLDNDGNPDLFYVTGNVYPEVERKRPQYPLKTPRVIFRNLGAGKFEELVDQGGPGISEAHCSRGCAFGDFDNDGDLDILIVNLNEPPSLLRNDVARQQSLAKAEADRHEIESKRDRHSRHMPLRRQAAGAGARRTIELLFLKRSAPAFRIGKCRYSRSRDSLAQSNEADAEER